MERLDELIRVIILILAELEFKFSLFSLYRTPLSHFTVSDKGTGV